MYNVQFTLNLIWNKSVFVFVIYFPFYFKQKERQAQEVCRLNEAEEADWMTMYRLSTYLMFLHLTLLPVNMSLYFYIVTICSLFYSDSWLLPARACSNLQYIHDLILYSVLVCKFYLGFYYGSNFPSAVRFTVEVLKVQRPAEDVQPCSSSVHIASHR